LHLLEQDVATMSDSDSDESVGYDDSGDYEGYVDYNE
jgi:hypothetical protein